VPACEEDSGSVAGPLPLLLLVPLALASSCEYSKEAAAAGFVLQLTNGQSTWLAARNRCTPPSLHGSWPCPLPVTHMTRRMFL
jgi:hypothetical protein